MVAEDRRRRRGRDRQFVGLAHGPGRAADRARGERDAVAGFTKKNIIANPNCSTAQLVVALKPLHDKATIKRVVVATYQSVSGAGKDAMDELFSQTKSHFTNDEIETRNSPSVSPSTSSPDRRVHGGRLHQGRVEDDDETKKILDPKIKLTATCVRVPVFVGHSEAVNIEFENPITPTRRATSCATRRAAS
jgi:aspartate-semialdehyde dehydrogenase